jgi:hypothetical protein
MSESTSAAPAAGAAAAGAVSPAAAPGAVAPGAGAAPAGAAGSPSAAPAAEPAIAASVLTDPPAPDPAKPAEPGAAAPETKPGEAKPAEETRPIEYADFELPEGLAKDNATLATFREEAAKLGLTQDQAQALVKTVGQQVAGQAAEQMQAWITTNEAWQATIKADPEIGGDHFEGMRTNVARLFDDFIGPATRGPDVKGADGKLSPGPILDPERKALSEALLLTGAGNSPPIVKAFARIAAAYNEGGPVQGSPARTPVDAANLLYPTHGKPAGAR